MPAPKKTVKINLGSMLKELSTLVTSITENYKDVRPIIVGMVQQNILKYHELVAEIATLPLQQTQKEKFEKNTILKLT